MASSIIFDLGTQSFSGTSCIAQYSQASMGFCFYPFVNLKSRLDSFSNLGENCSFHYALFLAKKHSSRINFFREKIGSAVLRFLIMAAPPRNFSEYSSEIMGVVTRNFLLNLTGCLKKFLMTELLCPSKIIC